VYIPIAVHNVSERRTYNRI